LDSDASCVQNGPNLLLDPTLCFLSLITKYNKSMMMETKTLFDFGASTCFIDKELVQQHKMIFVKKNTLVLVEVIDGRSLFLGHVMHETKVLDITIRTHTSKVAFNVISSPLGYNGSFCITFKWIGIQLILILIYLKKEHQIVRSLHAKTSSVQAKAITWMSLNEFITC
jgi:hypothetical protein